jgi:hypothetical protein
MTTGFRISIITALLLWAFGCAGGTGTKPRAAAAPDADIPAYASFGWGSRSANPPATILDNQIRNAVRAELLKKGYVESSEAPDFLVDHEAIEQQAVKKGNPVRIGVGVGSWGGNVGGSVGTSVDVGEKDQVLNQLSITIRALDPQDRRELWVGTTAALAERPAAEAVERAVAGLMMEFPGRRS